MEKEKNSKKTTSNTKKSAPKKAVKTITKKRNTTSKKKNKKKGFTLIELLAVIIILGVLLIIAVPSVTSYIANSRKNAYIDTAKEIAGSARNLVNSGKLEMFDTDTTYYIDSNCLETENGSTSPYGEFDKAYVVVTYHGDGYDYYWTSVDTSKQGIKNIIKIDKLSIDDVESDLNSDDISTTRGIDGRSKTIVVGKDNNCKKGTPQPATIPVNGETGQEEPKPICRRATTLHTAICKVTFNAGCRRNNKFAYGETITYGTLWETDNKEDIKAGDAFDCDVNNDGTYNPETERFYYVQSNGANSTLIYYSNYIKNGVEKVSYGSLEDLAALGYTCNIETGCNRYGPVTARKYLPTKTEWSHPGLLAPDDSLTNEKGGSTVSGGYLTIIYDGFDGNRSARMLKFQELKAICGNYTESTQGYLNRCYYLMEGMKSFEGGETGLAPFYLQTVAFEAANWTYYATGYGQVHSIGTAKENAGIRPVITIKTTDIEQ